MRWLALSLISLVFLSFHPVGNREKDEKIILIRVDEIGTITDGMDTITTDELSEYISKRLFKSYIGTGKMYESIRIEKIHDGPLLPVMEIILKEIHLGQKKALTDLCLHLYKQGFDSLKESQQEKIRKKFPVLFQAVI